ncbi:hypothetical protein THRCLA_05886 [Thraustotheca clavata]|uniref:VASt domain-containing protein n=1 Tax=Thraustotheca clavata TaxID=74557 RepID=A0A1V9ZRQ1_9STRA|nr:hypothetical protein THRCLA_05886 [Thraustotheca clavata]
MNDKILPRTLSLCEPLSKGAPFVRTTSAPPSLQELKDPITEEYELVLAQILPLSLSFVFEKLWKDPTFTENCLKCVKESNIHISEWQSDHSIVYTAFERPESFMAERKVCFTHNKKNFLGPGSIPTVQIHRYTYLEGKRLIVSTTSTISDAPYCDYFRAEARWVFTYHSPTEVFVESGSRLKWEKNTWLKGQIESLAKTEAAQIMQFWVKKALEAHGNPPDIIPVMKSVQTTMALTPETTLQYMRLGNLVCLILFIFVMVQFAISINTMRMTNQETVRLQKKQNELITQLLDRIAHFN